MAIQPWQIATWRPIATPVRDWRRSTRRLRNISTTVNDDAGRRHGLVLWGVQENDMEFGVAWEWVAVGDRVIALADPMSLLSNLILLKPNGDKLSEAEQLFQLHQTVNELPWQASVRTSSRLTFRTVVA